MDRRAIEVSYRTAWETYLITVAADKRRCRPGSPFQASKLNAMMGGALDEEGRDVEPRNTQFELYIAALLHLAGLTVLRGEPDLLFDFGFQRVGVAAKRIKSLRDDQVTRHVKKARNQVVASSYPGWIALNFDRRFDDVDPLKLETELLQDFERIFDQANRALVEAQEEPSLMGFMIFGFCSAWASSGGEEPDALHTAYPSRWVRWADGPMDEKQFDDFSDLWHRRVETRLDVWS